MSMLFDKQSLQKGATFSPCRTYRYALWRIWDHDSERVMFIGLNPSTADETEDDPTIRRCIGFAKSWGYGGIYMLNAYAFRATKPKDMQTATVCPIGPCNDSALAEYAHKSELHIAAWGSHCTPIRELDACVAIDKPVYCLGKTKHGRPKHPLYLKADTERELFWTPTEQE